VVSLEVVGCEVFSIWGLISCASLVDTHYFYFVTWLDYWVFLLVLMGGSRLIHFFQQQLQLALFWVRG
jgi:hypothetical protein